MKLRAISLVRNEMAAKKVDSAPSIKVNPIVTQALSIKVATPDDLATATEILARLNTAKDSIEEKKSAVLDPLNMARKAEIARWKPALDGLESAIEHLRCQASVYQTLMVKIAQEEEERIAGRIGSGKGSISLTTATRRMAEVERPAEKVNAISGSMSFRATQVLKIVDASRVPQEYLMVNEEKVFEALKAGKEVAGAVLETLQVPVSYRK